MNWILTGLLLGSLVTSTHETEEACEGRRVMLNKIKEVSIYAECHRVGAGLSTLTSTNTIRLLGGTCGTTVCGGGSSR